MLLIMPGDSYLSSRSYSRRGYSVPRFYDDTYVPRYIPHRQFLDTTGEENSIRKSVNRELMLTSHFVDDAYDLANSSHKRDEEVLKHASQAIVDTELYHNPRAAVASRRARSQPPQHLQVTQSVYRARASVPPRGASPPPRSYVRRANREVVVVYRPRRASFSEADFRKPVVTAGWRYPRAYYNPVAYPVRGYVPRRKFFVDALRGVDTRSHYAYGSSALTLPMFSRLYYPTLYTDYVPPYADKTARARVSVRVLASPLPYKKKFARKAALVGSKVDVVLPKHKRPKSKYAAAVIREINLRKHLHGDEVTPEPEIPTSHLHASPRPVYLSRGTYDDTDGLVKKPKNDILSWKHRLESRIAPSDLLFTPKVYANVRSKLRDVQEKMDRHRQLMDRYLDAESLAPDTDIKTKVLAMYSEMEERDPLPDKK